MKISLNTSSIEDYERFLRIKSLPKFSFTGRTAEFPDEYAAALGLEVEHGPTFTYRPSDFLFDYQRGIGEVAIEKRKFCVFVDPGYGKTLIAAEHMLHAQKHVRRGEGLLWVAPLMVVKQTMQELERFYPGIPLERIAAADLPRWMERKDTGRLGIVNYDALDDSTPQGNIGWLGLDESSMLKSMYGKWGTTCIRLGRGLRWKLALTGTPAPNDQIEYANHAVFMDAFPTTNAFLARFFVNRGQTDNRWEMKPHAIRPFYTALSHWSIFMANPATYGWKDNAGTIPPIYTRIHEVPITAQQQDLVYSKTGKLFAHEAGGITSRSVLSQIAKGNHKGEAIETHKPEFIRKLVNGFGDRSTIIWCLYNEEQASLERTFPEAISIKGETPYEERDVGIEAFKSGRKKILISKGKVLGFGLNLQRCTRQVFSGLQDSYETYFQCVKRSNRVGSTEPLEVHIPITPIERPMIETVLTKAARVHADTLEQEKLFREIGFHRRNHAA